ncbi:MAG: zinc ribbon domain-containing protein [Clostridia bacterium]|nr:zinc ribbon domain-containing protein [Clostridia bacterium]
MQVVVAKNKQGSRSTKVDFLLRDKLFCGYCGSTIHGDSGTSKSGKRMYYYKCRGRKSSSSCNKSIRPKEKFEQLITNVTLMTIVTLPLLLLLQTAL